MQDLLPEKNCDRSILLSILQCDTNVYIVWCYLCTEIEIDIWVLDILLFSDVSLVLFLNTTLPQFVGTCKIPREAFRAVRRMPLSG